MGEISLLHYRQRDDVKTILRKAGPMVDGLNTGGDVRMAWDGDNEDECRVIGKAFDELRKLGFSALKVGDEGTYKDGEKIEKWDPKIGRMVMLAPIVGGKS